MLISKIPKITRNFALYADINCSCVTCSTRNCLSISLSNVNERQVSQLSGRDFTIYIYKLVWRKSYENRNAQDNLVFLYQNNLRQDNCLVHSKNQELGHKNQNKLYYLKLINKKYETVVNGISLPLYHN